MRTVGTVSRGVRLPIVKQGEDLVKVVTDSIVEMGKEQRLTFHEKDVVAVTESVVEQVVIVVAMIILVSVISASVSSNH